MIAKTLFPAIFALIAIDITTPSAAYLGSSPRAERKLKYAKKKKSTKSSKGCSHPFVRTQKTLYFHRGELFENLGVLYDEQNNGSYGTELDSGIDEKAKVSPVDIYDNSSLGGDPIGFWTIVWNVLSITGPPGLIFDPSNEDYAILGTGSITIFGDGSPSSFSELTYAGATTQPPDVPIPDFPVTGAHGSFFGAVFSGDVNINLPQVSVLGSITITTVRVDEDCIVDMTN